MIGCYYPPVPLHHTGCPAQNHSAQSSPTKPVHISVVSYIQHALPISLDLISLIVNDEDNRWYNWLRHYATNRQVVGSIPDVVIGIFQ